MKPSVLLALLGGLAACVVRVGPQPEKSQVPTSAAGIGASLTTATQTIAGELLEVRDTAFVILADRRVTLVPNGVIRRMRFDELPSRETLTAGLRNQLRLKSRFPYGIPDAALTRLMASFQQTALVVIDK